MQRWLIPLGPVVSLGLYVSLLSSGWDFAPAATAAVTFLCTLWWVFEPVSIPFTSMIPLALFPLLGILTPSQVAQAYGSSLILLLLGGFMISTAMADSGAHRRIALYMVNLFGGGSARSLVFGFMTAAAVLSMWISNTATTLMLLPVALAVLERAERQLAIPLLLGIAYAANIGGLGTPIGTPPNLIFMQVYSNEFGQTLSFPQWMSWGLPVVAIMVPITGLWLTRGLQLTNKIKLPSAGQWTVTERRVLGLFALTVLAWITRQAPFGGWSQWFGLPTANDASVALLAVIVMALTPNGKGGQLLRWEAARKIPWGVLILFGGGITIATAFMQSGLAEILAGQLQGLAEMPVWMMILVVSLAVTFMTEMTSNTATASLLMPLLAAASVAMEINPILLMIPAALSASCAFMLPVATAPNAVVYGSGQLSIKDMARAGLVLNLAGALVITLISYLFFA